MKDVLKLHKRRKKVAKHGETITKLEIIQTATRLFLEKGFSKTTASLICKDVGISTGNLTFYFPTKEHVLEVIMEIMCEFQWKMMEEHTDEGKSSLLSYCLELSTMMAISEESEIMRDLYLSAYTHPMTIECIRANDTEKIAKVFSPFCPSWSADQFMQAESIISGIEYSALMVTKHSPSLDDRVAITLDAIMKIFGVPDQMRALKIQKILAMDYRAIGRKLLDSFIKYADQTTENAIEEKINSIRKRK